MKHFTCVARRSRAAGVEEIFRSGPATMKRCIHCESPAPLADSTAEASLEVTGHRFVAAVPAKRCSSCNRVYFEPSALERFDRRVAVALADAGASSGSAFRFMRKSLGLRASELAQLLDVSAETISRWETEKRSVDRGALALVGGLVRDALEGRTSTMRQLRALREPRPLAETVTIDLSRVQ